MARHRRVPKLVQQYRSEKRQNVNRGAGPGLLFADSDEEQEDQKQQKREVEPDGNSEDAENADGSPGERLISHLYFNSTASSLQQTLSKQNLHPNNSLQNSRGDVG